MGENSLVWKTVNNFLNRKNENHKEKEITLKHNNIDEKNQKVVVNIFNEHCTNLGKELANKITQPTSSVIRRNLMNSNIFFSNTDQFEVSNCIKELKIKKSTGYDQINSKTIKSIGNYIASPLSDVINKIFVQGKFPNSLKTGIISPIFKKGDKKVVSNYRPISVISNIAKIVEKVIKKRIVSYLETNNILSSNQFGFRQGVSTEDAIFRLTNNIHENLDNNKAVLCVFLDLAKAFDTVNHTKLLTVLEDLGFRGVALDLIGGYLENRVQRVKVGGELSEPLTVEYGVPQGTVLGPVLFTMYINGLLNQNTTGDISSFADDTVIMYTAENWNELKTIAEGDLKIVKSWFDEMYLTINFDKTKFIPFSCNRANIPAYSHLRIIIENREFAIYKTNSVQYLGIEIDRFLRWDVHVNNLIKKLRSIIFKFRQLKSFMNHKNLKMIYHALVESLLQYGITGWGSLYKSHLDPLEKVQKIFIKIICSRGRLFPTDQLFRLSGLMDIRQLFSYRLLLLQFRKKIPLTHIIHTYDTRHKKVTKIKTGKANKSIGQRMPKFILNVLYGKLPDFIRNFSSFFKYKKSVRSWILSNERQFIHTLINMTN